MTVVLVRHIETKQAIGIFWTNCMANLWDTIDEEMNPAICEFKILTSGGIIFDGGAPSVPLEHPSDFVDINDAELSEAMENEFMQEGKWRKIPNIAEEVS